MNRLEIRTLLRTLIDEPDPYPDGTFTDDQLNTLINLSKDRITLALSGLLPGKFRSSKLVPATAGKASYSIIADWSITDALAIVDIIRYKATEDRLPLLHTPNAEDLALISNTANLDALMWGQEKEGYIELSPPSKETLSDRYKVIYVVKFLDLNHDTSDVAPNVATPGFDSIAHSLIAYDAAEAALAVNERVTTDIERRKQAIMFDIAWNLSGVQGARLDLLTPARTIFALGASK